jgi:nitroreductase
MDFQDVIYGRRSIREYAPEPPSAEQVTAILTDAVQAPSGINRQDWFFVVAQGRERLARYSVAAKRCALAAFPASAPRELRAMLENPQFDIFYDAPMLVVICAKTDDPMAREDCCLAGQTLMLSAYAHGLGTCRIGFADAWLATPQARAELGVAEPGRAVAAIILGRARTAPPSPGRKPPEIAWLGSPTLALA